MRRLSRGLLLTIRRDRLFELFGWFVFFLGSDQLYRMCSWQVFGERFIELYQLWGGYFRKCCIFKCLYQLQCWSISCFKWGNKVQPLPRW